MTSFYLLFHILLHQQDQIGQLYLTVFIHIGIELIDLDREAGQVFFEIQDVQQAAGLAVIIYIAKDAGNDLDPAGGDAEGYLILTDIEGLLHRKGDLRKAILGVFQHLEPEV